MDFNSAKVDFALHPFLIDALKPGWVRPLVDEINWDSTQTSRALGLAYKNNKSSHKPRQVHLFFENHGILK